MPDYSSLSTQIDAVKTEITDSLAASTYNAQELVYVAKALETLGTLLGVNDIVAATADGVTAIETAGTDAINLVDAEGVDQVLAVNTAGSVKLDAIAAEASDLSILSYMGVLA